MTLNYGIFDVSDPQNPDRVYSAALLSRILSKHIRDGIVHGDGGELAVSASDPPAMTVKVATGTAMVQGRFCENDAALTLSVPAADTTYARIDRVVVRLNASPGRVIDILVKKGTPAPSPVPPGLTRAPETWELSLAQISVAAGATMVQAANITDERGNTSLCGVAAPVYVPSSQVEVVGAINMQGHALTGLPVPSAGTDAARKDMGGATLQNLGAPVNPNDAARKAYVDAKVAGFGISQIAIDADKDWNGKSITNLGSLVISGSEALMIVYPSDVVLASVPAEKWFNNQNWATMRSATVGLSGAVRVKWQGRQESYGEANFRVVVGDHYYTQEFVAGTSYISFSVDVPVLAGETVVLQAKSVPSVQNFRICGSAGAIPFSAKSLTGVVEILV